VPDLSLKRWEVTGLVALVITVMTGAVTAQVIDAQWWWTS